MNNHRAHPVEWIYSVAFLLYLLGSALAHLENGTELSLWLMTFAVTLTAATTLLPLAGIRWLHLAPRGCRTGYAIAILLQLGSFFTFGWAMFMRLGRNLVPFNQLIILTTLLWAAWLLLFFRSRQDGNC